MGVEFLNEWLAPLLISARHPCQLDPKRRRPLPLPRFFRGPLPPPCEDREPLCGRSKWKDVGKVRRMFITCGVSMFAEAMRPELENHCGRSLSSFSEVVTRSLPFWDKLPKGEKDGWQERAIKEKKEDHYIYVRKNCDEPQPPVSRERCEQRDEDQVNHADMEDDSDPDELPGPLVQSPTHHESSSNDVRQSTKKEKKSGVFHKEAPPMTHRKPPPGWIPPPGHSRADALHNWTPANRSMRTFEGVPPPAPSPRVDFSPSFGKRDEWNHHRF